MSQLISNQKRLYLTQIRFWKMEETKKCRKTLDSWDSIFFIEKSARWKVVFQEIWCAVCGGRTQGVAVQQVFGYVILIFEWYTWKNKVRISGNYFELSYKLGKNWISHTTLQNCLKCSVSKHDVLATLNKLVNGLIVWARSKKISAASITSDLKSLCYQIQEHW